MSTQLKLDEFYDIKKIGSGRKDKICVQCGKVIKIGTPHFMQTFLPDPNFVPDPTIVAKGSGVMYRNFPTHIECSEPFQDSLI